MAVKTAERTDKNYHYKISKREHSSEKVIRMGKIKGSRHRGKLTTETEPITTIKYRLFGYQITMAARSTPLSPDNGKPLEKC